MQEWPKGSIEQTVQNAVKSWEMELSHKTCLKDFKTINPEKFKLIVNGIAFITISGFCNSPFLIWVLSYTGRRGLSGEETLELGSYNAMLKNSLPEEFQYYKADKETFESSHNAFRSAFPRGFAWEVIGVYSEPPVIAYKFRHWGYFEGPFQGHAPTGEMVEFCGIGIMKVDSKSPVNSFLKEIYSYSHFEAFFFLFFTCIFR